MAKLELEFTVDDKGGGKLAGIEKGLRGVNAGLDSTVKKTKAASRSLADADIIGSKVAEVFRNIAGSVAAAAASFLGVQALIESIREFGIEEKAVLRLRTVLQGLGEARDAEVQALLRQAEALTMVTAFEDDQIITVQGLLATYGLVGEQLDRATKATLDFAASGIELEAAARVVGKSFLGVVNQSRRYGIVISENIPVTQRFEALLGFVERRFGGLAQADAESFIGRLKQLGNEFGEVRDALAGALLPELAKEADFLKELTRDFGAFIQQNEKLIQGKAADFFENINSALELLIRHSGAVKDLFTFLASSAIFSGIFKLGAAVKSLSPGGTVIAGLAALTTAFLSVKRNVDLLVDSAAELEASVERLNSGGLAAAAQADQDFLGQFFHVDAAEKARIEQEARSLFASLGRDANRALDQQIADLKAKREQAARAALVSIDGREFSIQEPGDTGGIDFDRQLKVAERAKRFAEESAQLAASILFRGAESLSLSQRAVNESRNQAVIEAEKARSLDSEIDALKTSEQLRQRNADAQSRIRDLQADRGLVSEADLVRSAADETVRRLEAEREINLLRARQIDSLIAESDLLLRAGAAGAEIDERSAENFQLVQEKNRIEQENLAIEQLIGAAIQQQSERIAALNESGRLAVLRDSADAVKSQLESFERLAQLKVEAGELSRTEAIKRGLDLRIQFIDASIRSLEADRDAAATAEKRLSIERRILDLQQQRVDLAEEDALTRAVEREAAAFQVLEGSVDQAGNALNDFNRLSQLRVSAGELTPNDQLIGALRLELDIAQKREIAGGRALQLALARNDAEAELVRLQDEHLAAVGNVLNTMDLINLTERQIAHDLDPVLEKTGQLGELTGGIRDLFGGVSEEVDGILGLLDTFLSKLDSALRLIQTLQGGFAGGSGGGFNFASLIANVLTTAVTGGAGAGAGAGAAASTAGAAGAAGASAAIDRILTDSLAQSGGFTQAFLPVRRGGGDSDSRASKPPAVNIDVINTIDSGAIVGSRAGRRQILNVINERGNP